ncbi:MAG: hypothetical protein KKD01_19820 [Proteobacteria bacterium]|nr:hypothetical protein [Pseudomonadota bacterium]
MSPMIIPMMTVLSGAMDYAAKGAAAQGMMAAAQRKQLGANFAADQMDVNAGQQIASSQRAAQEKMRMGELGLSRVQALAATQGGATTDPTVMRIKAAIMAEGAYRAAQETYQGAEAARGLKAQADATRYMGDATMADAKQAQKTSRLSQAAGVFKTGTMLYQQAGQSMGEKYGGTIYNEDSWMP